MFLKAGALSLSLLLASRVLGLLRESALAAGFGTSAVADLAMLMLSLPDWIAGVLASGALAYALLPAWAGQDRAATDVAQRRVATVLLAAGVVLMALLIHLRAPILQWLAPGLPAALQPEGTRVLLWSAASVPLALLAVLWVTRLQHEGDFGGLYGASLWVNAVLIAAIAVASASRSPDGAITALGAGLTIAMAARLLWLGWRQRRALADRPTVPRLPVPTSAVIGSLPAGHIWLWAMLSAGLPLALPFVARSAASQAGEGALASFGYAWKLVELPLVLAIQLVATLTLPAVSRALASNAGATTLEPVRSAFALAWTLGCAAVAGLLIGAPAIAQVLFGWGRMSPDALGEVAQWARTASWGLLPQALIAVALTVLASQRRLHVAALAYAAALAGLLAVTRQGVVGSHSLMVTLNILFTLVALATVSSLGRLGLANMPWRAMIAASCGLLVAAAFARWSSNVTPAPGIVAPLLLAVGAATLLGAGTWWTSADLRHALRR